MVFIVSLRLRNISNLIFTTMVSLLKRMFKLLLKLIASLILAVSCLVFAFYTRTTSFDFPETKPFSGPKIFNPYQEVGTKTYKGNFHGHSKSWKGVTNGANPENEVIDAYINKGYDIACLSNYHKISLYTGNGKIINFPVYEHGFNVRKSHCLAINAREVSFLDFPLWQSSSHQQSVIHAIRKNADIVAIAHPKFGGGRSFDNMRTLTGYHLTEVLNHYRVSDVYWDQALSVGRLSWIIGNDDMHAVNDPEIFQIWNNIFSDTPDSVLVNLKNGKNYATQSFIKTAENALLSCQLKGADTIRVVFAHPADIYFIGQDGVEKQKTEMSDTASYVFAKNDTYIRVVARNANSSIYLNPLVRCDGERPVLASELQATQNSLWTWIWRISCGLMLLFSLYAWWKVIRW